MRPVSLCRPWKPAITATSPRSLKRATSSPPLMARMRAAPWALEVTIGSCQPCQERALTPMPSSTIASSPAVTCSPEATTASYSRASCRRRRVPAPAHQLVGLAGHGGDHDGHLVAGVDLALDVLRDIADSVEIGDRGSAEFHHQAGHGGPSLLLRTRGPQDFAASRRAKRRVYIAAREWGCNRAPERQAMAASATPEQSDRRRRRDRAF